MELSRLDGIDALRVLAMIVIFLFHASIHMGCTYGLINGVIKQGAVFMVLFFMISGFVLHYMYAERNLSRIADIIEFYYKHVCALYPAYMIVCIYFLATDKELSWLRKIVLLPMDIFMLQSSVSGSFDTWHHGGTWFVSCLFFCYLVTPFGITFIKQLNKKQCIAGIVIGGMIISYMQIAVHVMGYDSIYANVIYRCLEFLIGMQLARMYMITGEKEKYSRKKTYILLKLPIRISSKNPYKYCKI